MPNAGSRNVSVDVRVGPMSRISRKYSRYATPLHSSAERQRGSRRPAASHGPGAANSAAGGSSASAGEQLAPRGDRIRRERAAAQLDADRRRSRSTAWRRDTRRDREPRRARPSRSRPRRSRARRRRCRPRCPRASPSVSGSSSQIAASSTANSGTVAFRIARYDAGSVSAAYANSTNGSAEFTTPIDQVRAPVLAQRPRRGRVSASHATSATPPISTRSAAVQTGPSGGATTRMNTNDRLQIAASATSRATSAGRIRPRRARTARAPRARAARACDRARPRSRSACRSAPMTRWQGIDDRDRIAPVRRADRAHRRRPPDAARDLARSSTVSPYGMPRKRAPHARAGTACPPARAGGRTRSRRPSKYASSCARQRVEQARARRRHDSGVGAIAGASNSSARIAPPSVDERASRRAALRSSAVHDRTSFMTSSGFRSTGE